MTTLSPAPLALEAYDDLAGRLLQAVIQCRDDPARQALTTLLWQTHAALVTLMNTVEAWQDLGVLEDAP